MEEMSGRRAFSELRNTKKVFLVSHSNFKNPIFRNGSTERAPFPKTSDPGKRFRFLVLHMAFPKFGRYRTGP